MVALYPSRTTRCNMQQSKHSFKKLQSAACIKLKLKPLIWSVA